MHQFHFAVVQTAFEAWPKLQEGFLEQLLLPPFGPTLDNVHRQNACRHAKYSLIFQDFGEFEPFGAYPALREELATYHHLQTPP